jgi:hypothetical protein
MSDRCSRDNARRKGKDAYWKGIPIADNPMNAAQSRRAWEEGYTKEWDEAVKRQKILNGRAREGGGKNDTTEI